ncbi:MAG: hypothetical protein DRN92_00795 [Thermoproteota archaeon]|nr:MAG: hypothetical protein DRN92_00795 [Candidatus Korarchaeota archaeon]
MILAENRDEMPKLNGHAIEKEVKLRIKHATFLGLLEKHGLKFSISKTVTQRDLIFDFPDFRLFRGDQLFRIRLENGKVMLTFKGRRDISGYSKRRIEIEEDIGSEHAIDVLEKIGIRVSEPPSTLEATIELLKRSGMIMVIEVIKERTPLNLEGWRCSVYLDKVRGLGEFVEIEGEGADQLVDALGLPKAVVMESYVEMLVRSLDQDL